MRRRNVLLTCGGLVLLALAPFVSDPTEANGVVHLRNDEQAPAELAMCGDERCESLAPTNFRPHLPIEAEIPVNVSTEHVPTTYRVVYDGSAVPWCLTLILDHTPPAHFVVPLSSAKPCGAVR